MAVARTDIAEPGGVIEPEHRSFQAILDDMVHAYDTGDDYLLYEVLAREYNDHPDSNKPAVKP